MKRVLISFIYLIICIESFYAYGIMKSHKQKCNVIYYAKTFWDNRVIKNTEMTESEIKNWHDYALNHYFDSYIANGGIVNGKGNSTFKYTNVIMDDGFCYQIFAFMGQYYGGCVGYVKVFRFDLKLEVYTPECIWSKQYDDYGFDYFNTIQQTYEKKCNEYITKIK